MPTSRHALLLATTSVLMTVATPALAATTTQAGELDTLALQNAGTVGRMLWTRGDDAPLRGNAVTGEQTPGVRVFAHSRLDDTEQSAGTARNGFVIDNTTSLIGAEVTINKAWTGGVAAASARQELDNADGTLRNDSDSLLLFTDWVKNGFHAESQLGYHAGDFAVQGDSLEAQHRSWSASVAGRYDFVDGPWTFGPFSRLNVIHGTTEQTQGDIADINDADNLDLRSRTLGMGLHITGAFLHGENALQPYARIGTYREFADKRPAISGNGFEGEVVYESGRYKDKRWHDIQAGLALAIAQTGNVFLEMGKVMDAADIDSESITLGLQVAY